MFKSEFNKNVLTLMTGTTIAQAIPVAISPILTRIYTPEDFGVFGLFIGISSIIASVVSGRYEIAIMLPKKDEDAINLVALGFIITFFLSIVCLVLVFFLNDFFFNLLENQKIDKWLYFLPISIFFLGLFNNLNYFNIRKKNFKELKNVNIYKSISISAIWLIIGYVKNGAAGLISGQIISQLLINIRLIYNLTKNKLLLTKISKKKIIFIAKKYKDFPKHNVPASLSDSLSLNLPLILLPKIYSYSVGGNFFFIERIIGVPISLVGKSFNQVFFQEMSKKKNSKLPCWPFFIKSSKNLLLVGFPISLFIFCIGPYFINIFFGEEWKLGGEIIRYLSIVFLIRFVVSTVSPIFSISGFIKRGALWRHFYLMTSLFVFILSIYFGLEFFDFLTLYVIHEIILYSIYFYLMIKSVRQLDRKNIN